MGDWVYDDGGRAAAGLEGKAGDCVARSIAIASGIPYPAIYRLLAEGHETQRIVRRKRVRGVLVERRFSQRALRTQGQWTADHGIDVKRRWFRDLMVRLGFCWVPTMKVGQGCTVHLRADELPAGRLVLSVSKHYVAMIDGVVHDTHDPSRGGTRCVYGYWVMDPATYRRNAERNADLPQAKDAVAASASDSEPLRRRRRQKSPVPQSRAKYEWLVEQWDGDPNDGRGAADAEHFDRLADAIASTPNHIREWLTRDEAVAETDDSWWTLALVRIAPCGARSYAYVPNIMDGTFQHGAYVIPSRYLEEWRRAGGGTTAIA